MLDDDHFDLDKVKDRIIEHLAVAKLRNEVSGQILCFVGPPGVGKTSLGQSIARALGRKFVRMSVGGVRDEAEIRGHRRTYIGAMPGTIIRSLRDAESRNPVILIDEIDKMGADYRGDPASAMLEVLDPEQNKTFRDHYLDLPFDLSKVLFICTANTLDTIPGPLLDRMDTIALSGLHRGREARDREALPAAEAARGRTASSARSCRSRTRCCARSSASTRARRACGTSSGGSPTSAARRRPRSRRARRRRCASTTSGCASGSGRGGSRGEVRRAHVAAPGVATGLAYTAAGGDVLFIEATAYPGKGELIDHRPARRRDEGVGAGRALVGALAHATSSASPEDWFEKHDIHIHVPAGAVPKDGPSAGVTMATAIASLVRGEPVADDVGMTGEITLTGQVLPIGGIREKSLAAQRAGLKRVILPRENESDLADLPPETREALDVHPGRHDRGRLRRGVRRQAAGALVARALRGRQAGRAVERLTRAALLAAIALLFPAHAARGSLHHAEGEPCLHRPRRGGALVPRPTSGARSSCARRAGRRYAGASRHLAPLLYARTSRRQAADPLRRLLPPVLGTRRARRAPARSRSTSPTAARSCSRPRRTVRRSRSRSAASRSARASPGSRRRRLAGGWLPILETPLRRLPAGVVRGARPRTSARRASSASPGPGEIALHADRRRPSPGG